MSRVAHNTKKWSPKEILMFELYHWYYTGYIASYFRLVNIQLERQLQLKATLTAESIPLKYEKRLVLRWIHHFKPNLINNMDHIRISGIEPSSVILSQTK